MSLLDGFSGYNQINVKREEKYKTTFITRWGTFSYERMHFVLSNAGATFQRSMQITFDDLIDKIIHIYLDELTVYSKRRSYVSKFQKVWLDPFKITFFLGENSYLLKDLQEHFFSFNTNDSHLKHYVEPTLRV
jgi:hypothetical protein